MSAMGMPIQVFPSGGPPSKMQPPPPPPPPSSSVSSQQPKGLNNGNVRKPCPQSYDPPPLGLRPEIKIPPNPMATLRAVPKPKPKDDFWVEEYRKERSKSPMAPSNNSVAAASDSGADQQHQQSQQKQQQPEAHHQSDNHNSTNSSSLESNRIANNINPQNLFNEPLVTSKREERETFLCDWSPVTARFNPIFCPPLQPNGMRQT